MVWLMLLIPVNAALVILLGLPGRPRPSPPWDEAPTPAPRLWLKRLQASQKDLVEAAGLPLSPGGFLLVRTGTAASLALAMAALLGPVSGLLGALAGWALVGEWVRSRQEIRLLRCAEQFREFLQSVISSLRAGRSILHALRQAHEDLQQIPGRHGDLLPTVLEQALSELNLGAPLDAVLRRMADRIPLEEVRLFTDAVIISRVRGGNLIQVLLTLVRLNVERFQVLQEVRVQTAQKRVEAAVVSAMPVVMLVLLTLLAPDYMAPLTRTAAGQAITGIGLCLVLAAYLISRRLSRIEV
ncbi:MAG TPA: type II secretion system F family protein [Symbiobacteriaceae bacterium]